MKVSLLNFLLFSFCVVNTTVLCAQSKTWVGTWSTAQQLVETTNNPPSPGLTNNSLRQVLRVSIGGDSLRVSFSNKFSTSAVTLKSVMIAVSTGNGAINSATSKALTFNGSAQTTMAANGAVTSDPISFDLKPRMDVAITINFGQTSASITGHPGSRTNSYLLSGSSTASTSFASATKTEHWYVINGIDVKVPSTSACVAILGNSITDGRGSSTDMQNRWPDILSERLLANAGTEKIGILNEGIGGNCVLKDCLGPSGVSRFDRDILNQAGVRAAIIGEGVNDLNGINSETAANSMYNNLTAAYKQMIDKAHAKGIKAYGITIMPFKGNSYYNQHSEQCRNKVNAWIRSGKFDAVIDFDKVMRSPQDTAKQGYATFQNDGLHPDAAGYKRMGESIDLNLFKGLSNGTVTGIEELGLESSILFPVRHYPNPFSDKATISFELARGSFVSLKVYSAQGEEIAELAGKEYSSGSHQVEFDRQGLSDGVLFYTIRTSGYTATRKMVVQGK